MWERREKKRGAEGGGTGVRIDAFRYNGNLENSQLRSHSHSNVKVTALLYCWESSVTTRSGFVV